MYLEHSVLDSAAPSPERVCVYHMLKQPRNFYRRPDMDRFFRCGGWYTDEDRDAAITLNSDEDIAWVRPGRERSGTRANLNRRTLAPTSINPRIWR